MKFTGRKYDRRQAAEAELEHHIFRLGRVQAKYVHMASDMGAYMDHIGKELCARLRGAMAAKLGVLADVDVAADDPMKTHKNISRAPTEN